MTNSGERSKEEGTEIGRPIVSFIIEGIPKSWRSKSCGTWMNQIRGVAAGEWGDQKLISHEVSVVLVYFYRDGGLDVDNMTKPILDALTDSVVVDDSQVTQILARKTELVSGQRIVNASPDVAAAIELGKDFTYVCVAPAPDHGVMP